MPCSPCKTSQYRSSDYHERPAVVRMRFFVSLLPHRASQIVRKRIEQFFGWSKTVGGLRKTRLRCVRRNKQLMCLTGLATTWCASVDFVRTG